MIALHENLSDTLSAFLRDGQGFSLPGLIAALQEHANICNTTRALDKVSGVADVEQHARNLHKLLTADILPVLERKLLRLDLTGGQANLADLIELLNALAAWEARSGAGFEIQRFRQRLADQLFLDMKRRTAAFIQRLDEADYAEMPKASALILQIDANIWVLEDLGQRQKMGELQAISARLARSVVRSVSRTIKGFLADGDMVRHFDVSAVLLYVEELVVAMLRVLESTREERSKGAAHPFILSFGEQIATANMTDLEALLSYYLRAMERALDTPRVSTDTFRIFATHAGMTLRLLHGLGRQGRQAGATTLYEKGLQRIYGIQAEARGRFGAPSHQHIAAKLSLLEMVTAELGKPRIQILPPPHDNRQ